MTIPLHLAITEMPIACELSDEVLAKRRLNILNDLWRSVETQQELSDGYAFRFPGSNELAQKLLAFVLVERQCCAFFQMELVFPPANGPIWLHLRGGEGVKQFIEAELTAAQT